MTATPIYLDHHATTPVDPRVLEAMLPWFHDKFGNPASRNHAFGWEAEAAVDAARRALAGATGAEPREIVFTSGATEANNLALQGLARAEAGTQPHFVVSAIEHSSVLDPVERLEQTGAITVTKVGVDALGRVDPAEIRAALRPETRLVSVMFASNEVGTLQPVREIGALCREHGVLYHCDAVQALGREPLDVDEFGIDLLSFSAHKLYGPKGAGALYVRRRGPRVSLEPLLHGGGHERGLRSGTLNVPGIVGMAHAVAIALDEQEPEQARIRALRDRLEAGLTAAIDEVRVHGDPSNRLAANLNVSFTFVEAEALLREMEGVAASTGAACASARLEPSHVLLAMGVPERLARSSVRFGLGRWNTAEQVDRVVVMAAEGVTRLRSHSPQYRMHVARAQAQPAGPAAATPTNS